MASRPTFPDTFGGELIWPGDARYDDTRTVWNAAIDHRPAVIVRCRRVDDVRLAVLVAREHGLEIGVRCGGHSVVGLGVPDGGLMIDLRPLADVRVDPSRRRANVQGGALLGALDAAAQQYGLATTAGNVSHTGVGGLALGGGMGWLARRYGLTCDNVVSFEVVTAEGAVEHASREVNPELFWGLRGGGGNFGIVTEFVFELHPVGTHALSIELDVATEAAFPVLAGWRELSTTAPRNATFTAAVRGGVATIGAVWIGEPDGARPLVAALRGLGDFSSARIVPLTYLELQSRDDTLRGHESRRYWKGHYLRELSDPAIEALLHHAPEVGAGLQAYGGAIGDAGAESAFSHREAAFEYVAGVGWTDPGEDGERIAGARSAAATMAPFAHGVYVNALSDEGPAGVRAAYPPATLSRLTSLKDRWDPDNVFHLNANIAPGARS